MRKDGPGKYVQLFSYISTGELTYLSKNKRNALGSKSKSFIIKDGMLYFRHVKKNIDI